MDEPFAVVVAVDAAAPRRVDSPAARPRLMRQLDAGAQQAAVDVKEDFQSLWGYVSPYWAGQFLDRWCTRTMRSRLEPMKDVARMVRSHRDLILNWFRARGQFSSGVVEGFNGKARVISKRAYGFRTSGALEVALYHALGALPEPELTHRFC